MKKYLSIALVLIMLLCLFPASTVFAAKEENISQLDLTVTAPVDGAKPSYNKIDGRGYYSDNGLQGVSTRVFKNGIAWFKSASSYISPGTTETFVGNTAYTVKINLLPKGNFEFADNVTAKINGITATVDAYDDGSILVVATLRAPKKDEIINQLNLSVTAPVDGEKPVYNKIDGGGYYSDNGIHGVSTRIYKNGIAWFKSTSSYISPGTTETFKGGSQYTIKITLTAKDGYKFAKALTAKINGKTATVEEYDDGSINVSVVLTATKKDANTPSKPADETEKPTESIIESTDGTTEPSESESTEETSTTDEKAEQKDDEGKDNDNGNDALIWIIIGVLVVLVAGAVIIIVMLKKKGAKKNAD